MVSNESLFTVDDELIKKKKFLEELNTCSNNQDNAYDTKEEDIKEKEYDYGYKIILNYPGEDGLIEDYINEMNTDDKKKDPNEMFNYGLNPDKWIKLLNKSILMHYERHIANNYNTFNNTITNDN